MPEFQTLLDGITVGGHKIEGQEIALNQIRAWRLLFSWVEAGQFALPADAVCGLHLVAGQDEALEVGSFRTSQDTISGIDYMPPRAEDLPSLFEKMVAESLDYQDIYERAALKMLARRFRNQRRSKTVARLETELGVTLDSWRQEQLIAGALLILAAWGREREATEEADELALKEGPRTVLQEHMLEVFGDFANLQL